MSFLATPYLLLRRLGLIRDNDPVSFGAGMWWTGYCIAAPIILLLFPSWKAIGFLAAVAAFGAVWHGYNHFLYGRPRRHEPPRQIVHADGRQATIIDRRYRRSMDEKPGSTRPGLVERLERLDQTLGLKD